GVQAADDVAGDLGVVDATEGDALRRRVEAHARRRRLEVAHDVVADRVAGAVVRHAVDDDAVGGAVRGPGFAAEAVALDSVVGAVHPDAGRARAQEGVALDRVGDRAGLAAG